MTTNQINQVCVENYGCGILAIDATGALWVAERIHSETGKNVYKTISNRRNKFGLNTAFPQFGSELFKSL